MYETGSTIIVQYNCTSIFFNPFTGKQDTAMFLHGSQLSHFY